MLIGLTGYAGSGKDTVAEYLIKEHGFTRLAFADKVRELAYRLNPPIDYGASDIQWEVNKQGWDAAKQHPEIRIWLQDIGTSCRDIQGADVWIDALYSGYWALIDDAQPCHNIENVVITDVRFLNEMEWIIGLGGRIVRVNRPEVGPVNDHPSETELDGWAMDGYIVNDRNLEDLSNAVDELINKIG